MSDGTGRDGAPRRLGSLLLLGMLAVPLVFVWFFLRRGYPPSLRKAAFIYAFTLPTITLVGAFGRALST